LHTSAKLEQQWGSAENESCGFQFGGRKQKHTRQEHEVGILISQQGSLGSLPRD